MTLKKLALTFAAVAAGVSYATGDWTGEPDYYVDYLEANGKQYIDTGVIGKSGVRCETDMMWCGGGDINYLGARNSGSTDSRLLIIHTYNNLWCGGYGKFYQGTGLITQNKKYHVVSEFKNGSQTIVVGEGVDASTVFSQTVTGDINTETTLTLFAVHLKDGSVSSQSSARCYSLKIWDADGNLVLNARPCVKNGEVCLYDKESGEYFRNKTATPLIAGPGVIVDDIPPIPLDGINPVCPDPVIRDLSTGAVLRKGMDYTLEYENNMSSGTATMIIVGMGRYGGLRDRVDFTVLSALYVSPDADDSEDEDCSSWEKAGTLAKACSLVADGTAAKPSVIMLWSGTAEKPAVFDYSDVVKGDGQHTLGIVSKNYVTIRSMDLNPTNCIVRGGGKNQDLRCLQVNGTAVIDGISFENFAKIGHVTAGDAPTGGMGAAIYATSGAKISNCIFSNNFGTNIGAVREGHITNCAFIGNENEKESGYHVGAAGVFTRDKVRNCYFFGNSGACGACSVENAKNCVIDSCLFVSNATSGVWMYSVNSVAPTVVTNCVFYRNQRTAMCNGIARNCEFRENRTTGGNTSAWPTAAAGLMAQGGQAFDCLFVSNETYSATLMAVADVLYATCTRCTFIGGRAFAPEGQTARGYHCTGSSTLIDCTIRDTVFTKSPHYRPACVVGTRFLNCTYAAEVITEIDVGEIKSTVISNCVFVGNTTSGNLLKAPNTAPFVNCLIVSNRSTRTNSGCLIASGKFFNCTIADNVVGTPDGAYPAVAASCTCSNTVIYGNGNYDLEGGASNLRYCAWGTANGAAPSDASNRQLKKNPFNMMVDAKHPWGFQPRRGGGGLVDRGFSDVAYEAENPFDLSGDSRICGKAIDIGCYENHEPSPGLILLLW